MKRSVNESYLRNPTPEERLFAAVFKFTERDIYVTRYDLKKLEERTMAMLTDLEAEELGSIHPGDKIENFYAETVYICRYPYITEMVDSFFKMLRSSETTAPLDPKHSHRPERNAHTVLAKFVA